MNALSVDVEDYFHVEAFAARISPDNWSAFPSRVEKNVNLILEIFDKYETKATFFILVGRRIISRSCKKNRQRRSRNRMPWLRASAYPPSDSGDLSAGYSQGATVFTGPVQKPVYCYRAPSFSITVATLWALDILAEEGFRIDSSIFPVRHDLYGIPDAKRFPHWRGGIIEFPPTTIRRFHYNFGVAGGGYLRLLPYRFTRWAIKQINDVERQPAMVYFHPWELDPDQPRISAPIKSRFRHYTNLGKMQNKIERLLQDFSFSTVSDACQKALTTDFVLKP